MERPARLTRDKLASLFFYSSIPLLILWCISVVPLLAFFDGSTGVRSAFIFILSALLFLTLSASILLSTSELQLKKFEPSLLGGVILLLAGFLFVVPAHRALQHSRVLILLAGVDILLTVVIMMLARKYVPRGFGRIIAAFRDVKRKR